MNEPQDNPIMTAYVSFYLEDLDEFINIADHHGLHLELLTTKELFDHVKFKKIAPHD